MILNKADADMMFKLNTNTLVTDDVNELSFITVSMTTTLSSSYNIGTEWSVVSVADEATFATVTTTT